AAAHALMAYAQGTATMRSDAQGFLFAGEHADSARPPLPKSAPLTPAAKLDEELAAVGFYFSGHPLDDVVDVLRRKRTTLFADALAQARAGAEAVRMAGGIVRPQGR